MVVKTSEKSETSGFKKILTDCRDTLKHGGIKALIKKYSWKILLIFFLFYLIRDTILYVLIPYLVAKQFFQ